MRNNCCAFKLRNLASKVTLILRNPCSAPRGQQRGVAGRARRHVGGQKRKTQVKQRSAETIPRPAERENTGAAKRTYSALEQSCRARRRQA